MPSGPWVLVIGMHRSGTSAVAGLLGALGLSLPVPADLMAGGPDNPSHFESVGMVEVDDQLLEALGGSWSGPPPLRAGWERSAPAAALDGRARRAAARAFPGSGAVVWKDPRACLLLPYWRRLLPEPLAAVFVWRAPLAVARSLRQRDGLQMGHGLRLWERYNRDALAGLAGLDALVVNYDDLVADPIAGCGRVARWLDGLGSLPVGAPARVGAAARILSGDLRHQAGDGAVPDAERRLVAVLRRLDGAHFPFPDLCGAGTSADAARCLPSPAAGASGAAVASLMSRLERAEGELSATRRELDRVYASTSWRLTAPARAVSAFFRRPGGTGAREDRRPGRTRSIGAAPS